MGYNQVFSGHLFYRIQFKTFKGIVLQNVAYYIRDTDMSTEGCLTVSTVIIFLWDSCNDNIQ